MYIMKSISATLLVLLISTTAMAGTWMKSRGTTPEEAFYKAQEKWGKKFVRRGSCTVKQPDGYYYCDVLIED